jgi:hypothetical protein
MIAVTFPMIGKVIPLIQILPFNFLYYSTALLSLFYLFYILIKGKRYHVAPALKYLLLFNIYFFVNLSLKAMFAGGAAQQTFSRTGGPMFAIIFILFVYQSGVLKRKDEFLKNIAMAFGIYMVLQTVISSYESLTDASLGEYEIKTFMEGVTEEFKAFMEGRDILNLFNLSQEELFGFRTPFKGMIGQHNYFGSMLAFLNTLFLYDYMKFRRTSSLIFLGVALFAIIGNTTRMAMITMLLSDLIVAVYLLNRPWLRKAVIVGGVIAGILFGLDFYLKVDEVFEKSNTLIGRVDIWAYLVNSYFYNSSVRSFFVGLTAGELLNVGVSFFGRTMGSYENQFFSVYLLTGSVGLSLFLYAFFIHPFRMIKRLEPEEKIILFSLMITAFLTSTTLDCILHYSSYSIFLIILMILGTNQPAQKGIPQLRQSHQ